jgi:hypothetical protein
MTSIGAGLGSATPTGRDYWLAYVPFNINFGWITVATIVNTVQVLQYVVGWDGGPVNAEVWAASLVCVAAGIGVWQVVQLRNLPFGLVVVWALGGIAVAKAGVLYVLVPAVLGAGLVALALLMVCVRDQRRVPVLVRG